MFEVGWALKDWVDVYAAPQTVVPFSGINYIKLFEALLNIDDSPNALRPSVQIARNITENFLPKYIEAEMKRKKEDKDKKDKDKKEDIIIRDVDVRQISISVNDLRNYDKISEIINQLGDFLIKKLQSPAEKKYFLERIDIAKKLLR